ncbi:hypothetical protein SPBR_00507 [Sporothrix brasiliensis 5110]|uniref:chitinase n=1 Tax=Sporothrix brasiliensis 5110 TaxID=1398154 RepID=A0A0C2FGQ3_9PEZI|nr:uncharacterized protein SPBR_00507 [Sporothrix brasiliensis 5110]KIH90243.1 hypothetical protein SPBR_00507 [Sporothrix brasiliensis 5110]
MEQITRHGEPKVTWEDTVTDRLMQTEPGRLDDPFIDVAVESAAHTRHSIQEEASHRPSTFSRGTIMFLSFFAVFQVLALLARVGSGKGVPELRNVMYLTGQHPNMPVHLAEQQSITHVALAFMPSGLFNRDDDDSDPDRPVEWPLFTTVDATRRLVSPTTKVLVAIGGWGDTAGFAQAARTASGRRRFARNVAAMVAATGADGVDVDWEYPGGNGEDYRQVPNDEKAWEIGAYPLLLGAIRAALGPDKLLTAAVPGKPDDMLAFTADTVPDILASVDFLNVMTYDLMNRRDTVVKHHSGVADSLAAVDAYVAAGCDASQINLGLAYYVKYYRTEHAACVEQVHKTGSAVGCPTLLMEDPDTGADLGRAGAFSWHDKVPEDVKDSFSRARAHGHYTEAGGGGFGYWDDEEDLWWSFDTADTIVQHKFPQVLQSRQLGGVFAWGLGEDGPQFDRFAATSRAWNKVRNGGWDVDVGGSPQDAHARKGNDKKSKKRNGNSNSGVTRDEL